MIRGVSAALVVALFVLVGAVFGLPAATAQTHRPAPLKLDVESLAPRIVTEKTRDLDVKVAVTNVSATPIGDLKARLERGGAVSTADAMRQTLTGQERTQGWTEFEHSRGTLQPGQRTEWTMHADLRSAGLSPNTVYPLLVNVNGTPDGGVAARLAEVHLSLPVLAAPGGKAPSKPQGARPVSVLWPVAGRPRVLHEPVGPRDDLMLADEQLAVAMRPGGRLNALVSAANEVRSNKTLWSSLCFAVDPELIATAQQMAQGYHVKTADGSKKGTGSGDAKRWLSQLRSAVSGHCVVTVPYAAADVSALAQSSPELATSAVERDQVVQKALGVRPQPAVSYVPGKLTSQGAAAYSDAGKTVLLSGSAAVSDTGPLTGAASVDGGDQKVVPFDQMTATALDAQSARGTPQEAENPVESTVSAGQPHVAGQNAISTLLLSAAGASKSDQHTVIVAPSPTWTATPGEYRFLLDTLGQFADAKRIRPVPLSDATGATVSKSVRPPPGTPLTADIPPDVVDRMTSLEAATTKLTKAMRSSAGRPLKPDTVVAGVRDALISVASHSWSTDSTAKHRRSDNALAQYHDLTGSVRVADPGRTISLGSESAPIPVLIKNRLPVDITVSVQLTNTVGLQIGKVLNTSVGANTSRSLPIPTKALRAGRFNVGVGLVTPQGTRLGNPITVRLASTEYGSFTVIVTATAAGALLLLSGRRIYRRLHSGTK